MPPDTGEQHAAGPALADGARPAGRPSPLVFKLAAELRGLEADHFDSLSVTALIESTGLRDVDARERYAAADTFALGEQLFPSLPVPAASVEPGEEGNAKPGAGVLRFVRWYVAGLAFLLPAAVQITSFVALGLSLWAWDGFTSVQATVVALATLASLVVTAPFVQGIAQRGHYYRSLGSGHLLTLELRRLTVLGLLGAAAAAGVIALTWLVVRPSAALYEFCGYYALLSIFWLAIVRLDVLDRRILAAPVSAAGIALVLFLWRRTPFGIVVDQWAGLAAVDLVLLALGEVGLLVLQRSGRDAEAALPLQPLRVMLARTWPAFAYGLLYYLFLFVDRLVAWTTHTPHGHRMLFRGDYEAGLDWALLVFFLVTAMLQYTAHEFSGRLIPAARRTPATEGTDLVRPLLRSFMRQLGLLLALGAASLALCLAALPLLAGWGHGEGLAAFASASVKQVYTGAATGYLVFAVGLFGSVLLQSLGRLVDVLKALALALVVDAVIGEAAAHLLGYRWATLGLVAGAAAFTLAIALYVAASLRHAPYYLSRALV